MCPALWLTMNRYTLIAIGALAITGAVIVLVRAFAGPRELRVDMSGIPARLYEIRKREGFNA